MNIINIYNHHFIQERYYIIRIFEFIFNTKFRIYMYSNTNFNFIVIKIFLFLNKIIEKIISFML